MRLRDRIINVLVALFTVALMGFLPYFLLSGEREDEPIFWFIGGMVETTLLAGGIYAIRVLLLNLRPTPKPLPKSEGRPETGVMQFGSDWPGVFLRGDYAGPMGFCLGRILDDHPELSQGDPWDTVSLRAFSRSLLASADTKAPLQPGVQRLKRFDECRRTDV